MSNTKKIIGIVAIVVVALLAGAGWYQYTSRKAVSDSAGSGTGAQSAATSSSGPGPVPAGSVAPNKGATSTPAGVAVPVVQGAGDPAGNVSYRSFNITIKNGAYDPSTVIVNQGDTVNLELTAIDASYGFDQPNYGFNTAIPKGKTQTIQFQALQSGDFTFYCASCGGPSSGPVGHIIVVAK